MKNDPVVQIINQKRINQAALNLSEVTTNQTGNLNLRLKALVVLSYLSEQNAYLKFQNFHTRQVALYRQIVVHDKMDLVKNVDVSVKNIDKLNQFDS